MAEGVGGWRWYEEEMSLFRGNELGWAEIQFYEEMGFLTMEQSWASLLLALLLGF